jgi:hypothetical protein
MPLHRVLVLLKTPDGVALDLENRRTAPTPNTFSTTSGPQFWDTQSETSRYPHRIWKEKEAAEREEEGAEKEQLRKAEEEEQLRKEEERLKKEEEQRLRRTRSSRRGGTATEKEETK